MNETYIYTISFKNTKDIYINKTKSIDNSINYHKNNKNSIVYLYIKENLNNDWSNVNISIIDSINMDEDLTYLLDNPDIFYKYACKNTSNKKLIEFKIYYTLEYYKQIYNIMLYNILNKKIKDDIYIYEAYMFYKTKPLL